MEIAVHLQQEHANLQDKLEILKEKSARLQEAEALVNDLNGSLCEESTCLDQEHRRLRDKVCAFT